MENSGRSLDNTVEVDSSTPGSMPADRQFDFWIGAWDVAWEGGQGTNRIEAILDGHVIQENFDGTPWIPLRGASYSVYTPSLGKWQQTWVDNNGSYLDFAGEFEDGRMVLVRDAVRDGKQIKQRMVWYNIAADELDWNWERSDDGGDTWQMLWHIQYRRRPGTPGPRPS